MDELYNKTLREVLELSASASPTPGGGSVSAVVACFGLAMTAMVCRLTVGREKYKDVEPHVNEILIVANGLIRKLEELADADMAEFNNYLTALRMPNGTDVEKAARNDAMQKTLKRATGIPMEIARACLEALRITNRLAAIGNKIAISDAGVASVVTEAALNGVLLSADINVSMIKDHDYVNKIIAEKEAMAAEAKQLRDEVMAVVQERIKYT
ncbi:MAG: Methenyltetrahydrofolate cyclohydrolase [Pelotomaculum sp. PtaU1.Bin035]|nr:MAG: Methenyltetrahydrofolate cyclohydrolase [Pelotomaculum sp. PtaU1.Bin035]